MEETKKKEEEKKPRNVRRAEKDKKVVLDKLVLRFFELRSASDDPNGEEVATLYDGFKKAWIQECKKYNVKRNPIKLRYEAFAESVEFYIKMEDAQIKKTAEENKAKDFKHWQRRDMKWYESAYFYILAGFNHEKQLQLLKNYYIHHILVKNVY